MSNGYSVKSCVTANHTRLNLIPPIMPNYLLLVIPPPMSSLLNLMAVYMQFVIAVAALLLMQVSRIKVLFGK